MRRPAVLTFISSKRRRATRRAIFPSTSSHTLSMRSSDPETTLPFDSATTHRTCAPRGVDERSNALCRLDAGAALCLCARAASPRSGSAIGQPWAAQ